MVKNIAGQAALWAIITELIRNASKYFGKKADEMNEEKMKEMLIANPRILIDYLIDQLKHGGKDFTENDGTAAEQRWKEYWIPRASNTRKPCSRNKLFTILSGILELDKEPDSKLYDMNFPNAKRRFVELGLKKDADFDQSINNMTEDPVHEFFDHFSKQAFTNVKNFSDETWTKIEEGFGFSSGKIKNGIAEVRNALDKAARDWDIEAKAEKYLEKQKARLAELRNKRKN